MQINHVLIVDGSVKGVDNKVTYCGNHMECWFLQSSSPEEDGHDCGLT
jgi:hypothetical protein